MQSPWWDASGNDSQLMQLHKMGTEGGGRNPVQESQYQELLKSAGLAPGSSPTSSIPLDATGQYLTNTVGKLDEAYFKKIKDFDAENPFVYDDVLKGEIAKAGTRLDPYYIQTLNDYTRGIDLTKSRSLEDQKKTLASLNADLSSYTEANKRSLSDALDKSRQGYADVGNYFSGAQEKNTAKVGLASENALDEYTRGKEQAINTAETTNNRNVEDANLKQSLFQRDIGSYDPISGQFKRGVQSEAEVRSQAIQAVGVDQQKRNFDLGAYAGPPPGADQNAYYLNLYSGLQ